MSLNWLTTLPAGITEADLIDLVDGVALHPAREAAVLAAIKAEPRLGLLVKQMREDRAGISALGNVLAPVGLAEGIEARLEAQAIESLAAAEAAGATSSDAIPISSVRMEEPGIWRLLVESAWPRRLATAASITIVGGLMFVGGREAVRAYKAASNATGVADKTPTGGETSHPPNGAAGVEPPRTDVADNTVDVTKPDPAANSPTAIAAANDTGQTTEIITPAQAVALAREGRLVVSIRAPHDSAATVKHVETLARTAGREGGWRSLPLGGLPVEYAMLSTPTIAAPIATPAGDHSPSPDITVAGMRGSHPTPSAPKSAPDSSPALPTLHPVVKAIYTLELNPSEKSLASLLRALREDGGKSVGAEIVLRKLEQPIVRPISLEPDDILWWSSGSGASGAWSRKTAVPIVIETLE